MSVYVPHAAAKIEIVYVGIVFLYGVWREITACPADALRCRMAKCGRADESGVCERFCRRIGCDLCRLDGGRSHSAGVTWDRRGQKICDGIYSSDLDFYAAG